MPFCMKIINQIKKIEGGLKSSKPTLYVLSQNQQLDFAGLSLSLQPHEGVLVRKENKSFYLTDASADFITLSDYNVSVSVDDTCYSKKGLEKVFVTLYSK